MFLSADTGCDRAVAAAAPGRGAAAGGGYVLAACILASSLAMIDGSVINVALPAIGRDLRGGPTDLQWLINAYLLPLSALLLLGGALGDRFGRRRLLLLGVWLFAAASALCALAPGLGWLWAARALQGVGAAILLPNSLAILGDAFSGAARGQAIGTWAASGSVAAAVGPLVGGWLIDTVGWREIFLLNLPIAAGAIWLALRHIEDQPAEAAKTHLDVLGAVLATASLGALAWGLTVGSGPEGWTPAALVAALSGLVLLAAFAAVERRRGDRAMTPLGLFGSRAFVGLSLLTLLLYGVLGGVVVLLPYVLIVAGGYSATAAGAALLPFPLLLAAASPSLGGLAGRMGPKPFLITGPLLAGAGVLAALRIGGESGYWTTVLPSILLLALGMAFTAAPLTNAVLGSVDPRHTGVASGVNSALARIGGLVVTALLGAILASRGEELVRSFHAAAAIGAGLCAAAAACALLLPGARDEGGAS